MYIEFDLREIYLPTLEAELKTWYSKYQIKFDLKILNKRAKLTFTDTKNYSFFSLTWNPQTINPAKYLMIEPMKIDKS